MTFVTKIIEEAADFGERFPDLSDHEAFVTVCEIVGIDPMQYADSAVDKVIMASYDGGKEAGRRMAHAYGLYEEHVS